MSVAAAAAGLGPRATPTPSHPAGTVARATPTRVIFLRRVENIESLENLLVFTYYTMLGFFTHF
jgi:hypothetical protein